MFEWRKVNTKYWQIDVLYYSFIFFKFILTLCLPFKKIILFF